MMWKGPCASSFFALYQMATPLVICLSCQLKLYSKMCNLRLKYTQAETRGKIMKSGSPEQFRMGSTGCSRACLSRQVIRQA